MSPEISRTRRFGAVSQTQPPCFAWAIMATGATARIRSSSAATMTDCSPPLLAPLINGYVVPPGRPPQDVSTVLSPSGAWASGAIVSTPRDLGTFIRGYLGARLFPAWLQRKQLRFVAGGESSPPGPGTNSAGLAVFRYETRCGTVFGHTGNFPGYVQFAAATRDGERAVTTTLNIPAPSGELLEQLREMQETAVCLLLRDTATH